MIGSSDPTPAHTGQRMRAVSRSARSQCVHCPDDAQVDAVAPEFQPDGAPGAVADGGDPGRVGPRLGAQHLERRMTDVPHPARVGQQRQAAGQHLLGLAQIAPAVEVDGQRHVSQLGERIGPVALDVTEPRALWSEQHRGSAVGTGRERKVTEHRQAVGRVLDRARSHRPHQTDVSDRRARSGRGSPPAEQRGSPLKCEAALRHSRIERSPIQADRRVCGQRNALSTRTPCPRPV